MKSNNKVVPKKDKEIKPFSVKHHNFYPCMFSVHIKQGFLYYLQVVNWKGIFQIEHNCPKFKSMEDALSYVEKPEKTASETEEVKPLICKRGKNK